MNNLIHLIKYPMKMEAIDDLENLWGQASGNITRFFTLLFKIVGSIATPILFIILLIFLIQFATAKRNGDDTDDIVKRLLIIGIVFIVVGLITGATWLWG